MKSIASHICLVLLMLAAQPMFATHNRAGEIRYVHISGYTYEITLLTYTYTPSAANEDRDLLLLEWGDGTASELPRIEIEYLPDDYQRNTYVGEHTFPGPGSYYMVMEDQNRNEGIDNITESVYVPFTVKTKLVISSQLGENSAPLLLNPPIDKAVVDQRFVHNPTAFDAEGDSLSYFLTVCSGSGGKPIETYTYPVASNEFYVDEYTGDLVWDAPTMKGRVNVAMAIVEHRNGVAISTIVRDIQIDVEESENRPPEIQPVDSMCVLANDKLELDVVADDPDGDEVYLTGLGGPFTFEDAALFPSVQAPEPVSSVFSWTPNCEHVRNQAYSVLFKAADDADPSLTDQKTLAVTVVGHPQELDSVVASIDGVALALAPPECNNASRMYIYRAMSSGVDTLDKCLQTIQDEFELIADTLPGIAFYYDDDSGMGLSQGNNYCYRTVLEYPDGALSYPSKPACVPMENGGAVIFKTSVDSLWADSAAISIEWTEPIGIDLADYEAPFAVELYRYDCSMPSSKELVYTSSSVDVLHFVDSVKLDSSQYFCYQLFWFASSVGELVPIGAPARSSSMPISAVGKNNEISLYFERTTSWKDTLYTVYRRDDKNGDWLPIGESESPYYIDTIVVNNKPYCYKILSHGAYTADAYPQDIQNWSPAVCTTPVDSAAPPILELFVDQQCANVQNLLHWTVPDSVLDLKQIDVLYKACQDAEFELLAEVTYPDTVFIHHFADSVTTMSGCYAIVAVDVAGNLSDTSNVECLYGCPYYILPNVFTPNGDGINERWMPIENRFVNKIDMELFNMWGDVVFSTDDPELNWNGYSDISGKLLPDGMFYYICDVYELWLSCKSEPRTIVGFVQKFSDGYVETDKRE